MLRTNIVEREPFHKAQANVLHMLKDALVSSFGPMGSYTQIIKEGQYNKYTKDGYTILNEIKHQHAIEAFAIQDIVEVARNTVKTVGDGTTSAVIMSSLFFDKIYNDESLNAYAPVEIAEAIKNVAARLVDDIRENKHDCTPEDIYNIALISTNGNEDIAGRIKQIYEKYGNNVFIDVTISSTKDSYVKAYDGMTLEVGYADPCYVNSTKGTSRINNARIYAFHDPIDTPEMQGFFMQIIYNNVLIPSNEIAQGNKEAKIIPTVIMAPKISADVNAYLQLVTESIARLDVSLRPPLLVVTNIFDIDAYIDLATMCDCKWIKKYNDPKMQEVDINKGLAPTINNISDWGYGSAELVEADSVSTQFINPKNFWVDSKGELDEHGEPIRVHTDKYNNYLAWLQQKLETEEKNGANAGVTGAIKRRINALNANMVEYQVGGISPTDRDADRDLVEDAVLNCRSAAKYGYGRASNIEGFLAANELNLSYVCKYVGHTDKPIPRKLEVETIVARAFYEAYVELLTILYKSMMISDEEASKIVQKVCNEGVPYDIRHREYSDKVISSIESDVVIIQSIAKIVSIMVTSNQCLLANPQLNLYSKD